MKNNKLLIAAVMISLASLITTWIRSRPDQSLVTKQQYEADMKQVSDRITEHLKWQLESRTSHTDRSADLIRRVSELEAKQK